jgi:hydroxymethylglutaryl-CoA lyase
MAATVTIREVGPRDGLQNEPPLEPDDRARLVDGLVDAGVTLIEAAAFVSAARVPAMAEPDAVMAAVHRRPGVQYVGLVPNRRGADDARRVGMDRLSVTLSASEEYSRRNVGRPRPEAVAEAEAIVGEAGDPAAVDVVISCAFGSPYDEVDPALVAELAQRFRALGTTVTLADTTGEATPSAVETALARVGADVGLHFHDTRRSALTNAYVALANGARRLDSSVGGLGGSPFAADAGGNLATEELVLLCDDLGYRSGIDLDRLLAQSRWLAERLGRELPSPLARRGAPGRRR